MLKQLFNMSANEHFYVACSGGVDSMAVADFYRRGKKNFTLAYFNHGTPQSTDMQDFIKSWAVDNGVPFVFQAINSNRQKGISPEEHFRNARYEWLNSLNGKIVTCHHLNDVAETWIFSSLHGNPKLIKAINNNIYRPFLINTKQEMVNWCVNKNVKWVEDISNKDVNIPRNRIRHNILPECLQINPGLLKVLKKKILAE